MNIGQAEIATLVAIRQLFVIDAELMKNRRLKVMNMHRIFNHVDAVFIGGAVGVASLHSAAGHPIGKTIGMMVASVDRFGQLALAVDGPSEFSAPDHKCFVEHAPLLQIVDQCCSRLIRVPALRGHLFLNVVMGIPTAMVELDETNTAFCESTSEEAVVCVLADLGRLWAVGVKNALRFI